ncbi:MAG: hypothetical protein LPD71_11925 [Shewanella sp.]|nr:hypothetical protein [Shewanella sp.]MCF1432085.1 hypothetical protein [Shewanella sp.]MCF1439415.1 hypothetical protein [Shewanella sp.]MCF1459546.1 hypothetical protein [Shewanella sp.]
MKYLVALVFTVLVALSTLAASGDERPTQHLKAPDVTNMQDAKDIFLEMNHELMEMPNIGMQQAAEIHILTYTLEKSVAYFADNLTGDKQSLAKQMVVVVEEIHLTSERNRIDALKQHLNGYSELVDQFLFGF